MIWRKVEIVAHNVRRFVFDFGLFFSCWLQSLNLIQFVPEASETVSNWHYNMELVEHCGNMFILCLTGLTAAYRAYLLFIKPRFKTAAANENV